MNKIVIDDKEIELSDDMLEEIQYAFHEYPDYTRFKEKNFNDECKRSHAICRAIIDYFIDKSKNKVKP